jgi:N,N'-diacetyllegionaminate synthase
MNISLQDLTQKVFIIAEIGNNHEGDLNVALKMIESAAEAGADAVKFQTIVPELLVSASETERIARLKQFQFTQSQFGELAAFASEKKVIFFSTPFDLGSAEFLNELQPVFKIASGDNNFFPLIDKVASFQKPMIISTGLSDMQLLEDLESRVLSIWEVGGTNPGLSFLHCVTSYPVPDSEANLGGISTLKAKFPKLTIGYSDHTIGIKSAVYAVAAGARIIEKHFTLDNNYSDFRDHQLSADPNDFRQMVDQIRELEIIFGSGERVFQDCEKDMHAVARRSIASARQIPAGTVLAKDDLIWIRPGTGLAPGNEHLIIGKKTVKALSLGDIITEDHVS